LTFDVFDHKMNTHTSNVDAIMPRSQLDLFQGTLDLLVLKTLTWGPAHGYAIARWIEQLTGAVLQIGEGSLYPALHRLEEREWVESEWQLSSSERRMRVYRLTPRGRAQLRAETATWTRFVDAVGKVLQATEQPA
jgi:PadR family transcriptional regulator